MSEPIVEPKIDPIVEPKFSADNLPKTKEDWNKLAETDPKVWGDLTQQNMDRVVRENRELQEKLNREQNEKQNLALEVNRFRSTPPVVDPNVKVPFSSTNYPKTQEEWDGLFLENPTFASDLRFNFLNRQTSINTEFQSARSNHAKVVQAEHPDMYVTEMDGNGLPKKDDQGKLVLKRDQNGFVMLNENSEKGKLWNQIWQESARPDGSNPLSELPNAPALMQAELERRLRSKGQAMVQSNEVKQNQVAVPGVTPPVVSKGSYRSKEEEFLAKKSIERGVYKDESDFFRVRDGGSMAVYGENRRPDFSKK